MLVLKWKYGETGHKGILSLDREIHGVSTGAAGIWAFIAEMGTELCLDMGRKPPLETQHKPVGN